MIFEKLATNFDIKKLQEHVKNHVLALEAVYQSPSFGGWSVLSSNSSYKDGWHQGHLGLKKDQTREQALESIKGIGGKNPLEYCYPTEICHGYLEEVIERIKEMGFHPKRARIIKLTAGSSSSWHRDSPDGILCVRLHVPILTNPGCFFEIEDGKDHMTADGSSYLVKVNRLHRVCNGGTEDRFHLVMDVKDTLKVSKFHQE